MCALFPFCKITPDGDLIPPNSNEPIKPTMINGELRHFLFGKWHEAQLLVARTYLNCSVDTSLMGELNIVKLDNNSLNIHYNNLFYSWPSTPIEHPYLLGWYYIPAFSRYVINSNGDVMIHETGQIINRIRLLDNKEYYTLMADSSGHSTLVPVLLLPIPIDNNPGYWSEFQYNFMDDEK